MVTWRRLLCVVLFLFPLAIVAETATGAGETPRSGWKDESELGIVSASGNSSADTFQMKQGASYSLGTQSRETQRPLLVQVSG